MRAWSAASSQPPIDLGAQIADRARQLVAPRRRLAEPERNRRRRALRVGDAHVAAGHLQDPPRRVAQLEDVAGVALDREVLVQRADERVVRDRGRRGSRRPPGWRRRTSARAAARRAGRARSPCTSSRCSSAARRPRRVAKPSAAIVTTASNRARVERRGTATRARTSANSSSSRVLAASRRDSATICCASTSSGASC